MDTNGTGDAFVAGFLAALSIKPNLGHLLQCIAVWFSSGLGDFGERGTSTNPDVPFFDFSAFSNVFAVAGRAAGTNSAIVRATSIVASIGMGANRGNFLWEDVGPVQPQFAELG